MESETKALREIIAKLQQEIIELREKIIELEKWDGPENRVNGEDREFEPLNQMHIFGNGENEKEFRL